MHQGSHRRVENAPFHHLREVSHICLNCCDLVRAVMTVWALDTQQLHSLQTYFFEEKYLKLEEDQGRQYNGIHLLVVL